MRALSTQEMLDAWERGLALPPIQRVLTLLASACAETPDALARLSVGRRDGRLLALRALTFGWQLISVATCPACGERLELNLNTADLRVGGEAESEGESEEILSLHAAGYELRFRLPNSSDLMAVADCQDAAAARQLLLERCLATGEHDGEPVAADRLPAEVVAALAQRMAEADPQGDVQFVLTCPQCSHQWRACLDIGTFFWSEINAWARRTLGEVHTLASAYGWREADILNMSAGRRQFYLSCIGG